MLTESLQAREHTHKLRIHLVKTIRRDGPEKGSWFAADDVNAKEGGELYQTAINLLCQDVWRSYRHRLFVKVGK